MSKLKFAFIQMLVQESREANLAKAAQLVHEAAKAGARVVALPEYFTCFVSPSSVEEQRETDEGPTTAMLSRAAKDNNVFLIGGAYPEYVPGTQRCHNTCKIFNQQGTNIATFRKLHMYDFEDRGVRIIEENFTVPGDKFITTDIGSCKIGYGICMDLRFPEVSRIYRRQGCSILMFISGFGLVTGPSHWETLIRARAIDNQAYVVGLGPARNNDASYTTYGHSCIANPWGDIIASADEGESIFYADIDQSLVEQTRKNMPIDNTRRNDLYDIVEKTKDDHKST